MVSFTCNICGNYNQVEQFATEPATCACGSNVRIRALIHLLSIELFGHNLVLRDFPVLRAIRGLGMTDQEGYARILAEKFDYTNTYYDREPRLDFTESHPQLAGMYDFILSADVLEHITPPVDRALVEVCRLLKPRGFCVSTIYCNPGDRMREHFPGLHEYRVVPLGDSAVLINRGPDGVLTVTDELTLHGGVGATIEMREFGITALKAKLLDAGFREIHFLNDNVPEIGILFDHDVSQPLIARKEAFAMDQCALAQLVELWRSAEDQRERADLLATQAQLTIQFAAQSKWIRLGQRMGLGPDFSRSPDS